MENVKAACRGSNYVVADSFAEIVSGSLPLDKREAFQQFLKRCYKKGVNKVFVESSRTVSRDAMVAEKFFQLSKEIGVTIVPADVPSLYEHDPNPAQKFLRRVIMAYTELEKDLTVQRLQAGLAARKRVVQQAIKNGESKVGTKQVFRAQAGSPKVNGRISILQRLKSSGKYTRALKKKIGAAVRKFDKGGSLKGPNGLQAQLRAALRLQKLGHETARRMAAEFHLL